MSTYIVRILQAHQAVRVKWGNKVSSPLAVINGVRRGRILSPVLFNLYIDDLNT